MKKLTREELLDLARYEELRPQLRQRIIEHKQRRRLRLGPHFSLLWEDRDSALIQIQEMLRIEQIRSEACVLHELATYNELVPGPGELTATLLAEFTDAQLRREALYRLADLREHTLLWLGDLCVRADPLRQAGESCDRLPAVSYLRFQVGDAVRVLEDSSHRAHLELRAPSYSTCVELPAAMRAELAADLRSP